MILFGIIVLYNCRIDESKTIISLFNNYARNPNVFRDFKLIIYDNSLHQQSIDINIPFEFEYIHDTDNKGLAFAYNYALKSALAVSGNWLLLLDQDSTLPEYFIKDLLSNLINIEKDTKIKAVVPKMCYNNFFFSPSKVIFGGVHRPIDMNHQGVYPSELFAIGSGSVIRSSFFKELGGFNEFFWMDCLDRWIYFIISQHGGAVFVTNSIIEHELSVLDYNKFMSEKRYSNILLYEMFFMKFYKSKAENFVFYIRLVKRIISFGISKNNRKYSLITLFHLKEILFSRKYSEVNAKTNFERQ